MEKRDVKLSDLTKEINIDELHLTNPIKVPNNEIRELLETVIERGALEHVGDRKAFYVSESIPSAITWLKIVRLPVRPDNVQDYDLFNRWQGVLSSLHEWGYRVYFLLQRHEGKTGLYIGVSSDNLYVNAENAIEQIMEATSGSMPGIELNKLKPEEIVNDITMNVAKYRTVGAITGLPSFFNEKEPGVLQTLDPLAFGIRGLQNDERDYALLVIADAISDADTTDIINRMRTLGSEIHSFVERTVNESRSDGESKQRGLNQFAIGQGMSVLMNALLSAGGSTAKATAAVATAAAATTAGGVLLPILLSAGMMAGSSLLGNLSKTITSNVSLSVSTSYLDKFAQYAEELTNIHVERMKQGRNLGYWNVGVYDLGKDKKDVSTVNGMLRSIYAGRETFVEPIRAHVLDSRSGALEIVRDRFDLIPLISPEQKGMDEKTEWHIFGKYYQYLSTPMNTKEFALATSLPKCDVPGLRFVKTAVRFANNPPVVEKDRAIRLGNVVNMGVEQNASYYVDHNDLVRHTLVVGSTGSGKSCSCKRILTEILEKDVPALIIEPAKDDYVRWAIKMNETLPDEKKFNIFMPGMTEFKGTALKSLRLCPFEPAAVKGSMVDMTARCENLISIINASLPTEDVLPVLIDETIYSLYDVAYPEEFRLGSLMKQQKFYPMISALTAMSKQVMQRKNYEEKVRSNLATCLETRFQYLMRGTRGKLLNVTRSTDYETIFDHPTIINISGISAARDKALIMSVLMLSLYEYRKSQYACDMEYRKEAQKNKLMHLTLIEEAHNVLMKPENAVSSDNPQKVVADLFTNILSEIRSYGEGMMIVDQYPTRLIPDAIKNTNYKIVHRLASPDDADVMAASMALRDEQKALIPCLMPGNAIIFGDRDDAATWVKMKKTDI